MKTFKEQIVSNTCILALFLIFIAIYLPVIFFGFIADDFFLVPLSFKEALDATFNTEHFRPLWYLSYPAVNALFNNSSYTHHLINIILHFINCLIAISIIKKFLPYSAAVLLVAVWSLLPWVAFPIAWISQRNDLLMAFFILLALHQSTVVAWTSMTLIIFAFLSKVTCLFFPLAYCFSSGLKQKKIDAVLGFSVFVAMFMISYWALERHPPQEHVADLPALLKILNHAKNFVVGWFLLIIPLPFFYNWVNISGFIIMFTTINYLIFRYAKVTLITKRYLIYGFLISLTLAMSYDLRITYLLSLFLLIALFSSLHAGFVDKNISIGKYLGKLSIVILSFVVFSVPATVATLENFNTGEYDITNPEIPNPQTGYNINNFYQWFREAQVNLLKR